MWTYLPRSRGSTAAFSANKYCLLASIRHHVNHGLYLLVYMYNLEVLALRLAQGQLG